MGTSLALCLRPANGAGHRDFFTFLGWQVIAQSRPLKIYRRAEAELCIMRPLVFCILVYRKTQTTRFANLAAYLKPSCLLVSIH